MKRISIHVVALGLTFLSAVASVGCLGQTTSTGDETDESAVASQSPDDSTNGSSQTGGAFKGKVAETLELKVHPTDENGGPSPEPWESQQGPSPEPWNGHAIMIATPTGGTGTKP